MVSCGGLEFISTLTKLLDRLFDFRSVASGGEEEGRDLKMHVMCNLLVSALLSLYMHLLYVVCIKGGMAY